MEQFGCLFPQFDYKEWSPCLQTWSVNVYCLQTKHGMSWSDSEIKGQERISDVSRSSSKLVATIHHGIGWTLHLEQAIGAVIIFSTYGTVATAQMPRSLGSEKYDEAVNQYHAVRLYCLHMWNTGMPVQPEMKFVWIWDEFSFRYRAKVSAKHLQL